MVFSNNTINIFSELSECIFDRLCSTTESAFYHFTIYLGCWIQFHCLWHCRQIIAVATINTDIFWQKRFTVVLIRDERPRQANPHWLEQNLLKSSLYPALSPNQNSSINFPFIPILIPIFLCFLLVGELNHIFHATQNCPKTLNNLNNEWLWHSPEEPSCLIRKVLIFV